MTDARLGGEPTYLFITQQLEVWESLLLKRFVDEAERNYLA